MKSILVEDFDKTRFLDKIDKALVSYTPEQIINVQFATSKFGYETKFYALIIVKS